MFCFATLCPPCHIMFCFATLCPPCAPLATLCSVLQHCAPPCAPLATLCSVLQHCAPLATLCSVLQHCAPPVPPLPHYVLFCNTVPPLPHYVLFCNIVPPLCPPCHIMFCFATLDLPPLLHCAPLATLCSVLQHWICPPCHIMFCFATLDSMSPYTCRQEIHFEMSLLMYCTYCSV